MHSFHLQNSICQALEVITICRYVLAVYILVCNTYDISVYYYCLLLVQCILFIIHFMLPDIYTYTVYITLLYTPHIIHIASLYIIASAVPGPDSDVALLCHYILNTAHRPYTLPLSQPMPPKINIL